MNESMIVQLAQYFMKRIAEGEVYGTSTIEFNFFEKFLLAHTRLVCCYVEHGVTVCGILGKSVTRMRLAPVGVLGTS